MFASLLIGMALLLSASRAGAQAYVQTIQVPMPDGVTLSTDVWRPLLDGSPRPVLLRRTPYGRAVTQDNANSVINAGYTLVSQDVRGRGGSGGTFEPFFDDKIDGKATIDWVAAQSWSNGKVGTYSASAEGIVQYMAMASAPAALRCAHVVVATPDVYEGLLPGGAWRTDLGTNWLNAQGVPAVIDLWKSHEVHDSFWSPATLSTQEMQHIDHPVFVLGGMFDIFSTSEVHAFRALQANVAAASRGDVFLVMGPWTHGTLTASTQGQLLYGKDAPYNDYITDMLAYFSWCLQGGTRPSFPAVRYYLSEVSDTLVIDPYDNMQRISASGEWRQSTTWPPPEAREAQLYLHADDKLSGVAPEAAEMAHTLAVNPADLVPSVGGANLTTAAGPYDQATLDMRSDVYVTQTETVSELVEVVGSPRASLWISSATSDVDVIVRAEVLTPAGRAIAFTDGILRGRFAQGFGKLTPMKPGEPVLFEFELGPLAVRLPKGYALRFAFSGSSTPRYEPNPNQAVPLAGAPAPIATQLTIHRDAAHPSRLFVPLTAGRLPGEVDTAVEGDAGVMDAGLADAGASAVDLGAEPDATPVAEPNGSGGSSDGTYADAGLSSPSLHQGCSCRAWGGNFPAGWSLLLAMGLPLALITRRRRR